MAELQVQTLNVGAPSCEAFQRCVCDVVGTSPKLQPLDSGATSCKAFQRCIRDYASVYSCSYRHPPWPHNQCHVMHVLRAEGNLSGECWHASTSCRRKRVVPQLAHQRHPVQHHVSCIAPGTFEDFLRELRWQCEDIPTPCVLHTACIHTNLF